MFTSIFLGYSAILGGAYTVSYAVGAITKGTSTLLDGKGLKQAARDFGNEIIAPLGGLTIAAEDMGTNMRAMGQSAMTAGRRIFARKPAAPVAAVVSETTEDCATWVDPHLVPNVQPA